jgi:uncharacterized protein
MNILKNSFFLILGLAIIFGSLFLFFNPTFTSELRTTSVEIGGISINVEIAETPEARAHGLSGRTSLPDNTGMLFIFDESEKHGFWMKDMHFAIDIVWIDDNREVIGVEKEVVPETFPQIFYPSLPIKYVLELPSGFIENHLIDIGEIVSWME